jgi:hypothetical protein
LIGLVWLEIQLVVHHMELVVRIVLLQILLPLQIMLILQILLILNVPIGIVIGTICLCLKVAGSQSEQSEQCNCQEEIFHRVVASPLEVRTS